MAHTIKRRYQVIPDLTCNFLQNIENSPVISALCLDPERLGQLLGVGKDYGSVISLKTLSADNDDWAFGRRQSLEERVRAIRELKSKACFV